MESYNNYNDFELLYLTCSENEEAYDILYNKYKHFVEMKAKKYKKYIKGKGLDYNDLIQEGMIGLSEAIRDFKTNKDVKFSTFANMCIERQINSALVKANRIKHRMLNESVSLDDKVNDSDKSLIDIVFDINDKDPSYYLIHKEEMEDINKLIETKLTSFEMEVYNLYVKNFNYNEISKLLGKSYKSIDSAIQRIKKKIKVIFVEKDIN